ncbi:hypothetical protein [Streptomyces sp. NPDC001816]|uniref:hypothetical protein n=1 Tax=Streptomyces sp. NPDC001816 TaxID=3364612 RepID=UPI00368A916B
MSRSPQPLQRHLGRCREPGLGIRPAGPRGQSSQPVPRTARRRPHQPDRQRPEPQERDLVGESLRLQRRTAGVGTRHAFPGRL